VKQKYKLYSDQSSAVCPELWQKVINNESKQMRLRVSLHKLPLYIIVNSCIFRIFCAMIRKKTDRRNV